MASSFHKYPRRRHPTWIALACICGLGAPLAAQTIYDCAGDVPDWTLALSETDARFDFDGRNQSFDIPQFSRAEGRDWPRAFTLIADFDSAIVLLDLKSCQGRTHSAAIFTQRGQTPILLAGCCELRDD